MKDLRVEIRFKNNNLYKKIFAKYDSVSAFCRKHDLGQIVVGEYLNLKNTPISKIRSRYIEIVDGYYIKKTALDIATALGCNVFEIFPSQLWDVVSKVYAVEIDSRDFIAYNDKKQLMALNSDLSDTFNLEEIYNVLKTLPPREESIIAMRFGLNDQDPMTLNEVAQQYKITKERVRQIEKRALRKLRHPARARKLLKPPQLRGKPKGESK